MTEIDKLQEENAAHNEHVKSNTKDLKHPSAPMFRYKFPVYIHFKPSTGISSAHRLQLPSNSSSSASPGISSVAMVDLNKSQAVGMLCPSPVNRNVQKAIGVEPLEASGSGCMTPLDREKFVLICNSTIKAVEAGGSVLIPISRTGYMLQLVEEISSALHSSGLGQSIQIFQNYRQQVYEKITSRF